jgi:hypothetical protein
MLMTPRPTFRFLPYLLLLLFCCGFVHSASLQFSVAAQPDFQAGVTLEDVPVPQLDGANASVGIAWSQGLAASLYLRHTTAFGPLGNLILELRAAGSTGGSYASSFVARGVAGSVAARLRLSSANSATLPLAGPASVTFKAPPVFPAGARHGVELGATWRASSALLVNADGGFFRLGPAAAFSLQFETRLLRHAQGHDLILGFDGYLLAGPETSGSGAVRIGRQFNRRRAAPWTVSVLFGAGPGQVGPGFRIEGTEAFGDLEVKLAAHVEPWRLDQAPLQLQLQLQQPLPAGLLTTQLTALRDSRGPALLLGAAWRLPLASRD